MKSDNAPGLRVAIVACLFAISVSAQETIDAPPPLTPDEQLVPVAGEPAEEVPGPEATELTDEQRLTEQFERFKMLLNDDVLDEADAVAKRVVELAIRVSGPGSSDVAKALTNLAIVQHRTRQYDAARQNFQAAVDIIEENEDRLNSQLVNPLKGLGASQLALGRPDLASETYGRAIHVTHVNEGPHNIAQVDLLESLAEVSLRLGEVEGARQLQDQIYALTLRHHGGDLLGLIPTLMRRAAWQHRAGFIFDERTTYRRVINIIEDAAGEDDLQLIEPLTRLGQSYFYVDLSGASSYQPSAVTSGEIYFKRAVRIAEDHPDSDWKTQAGAALALGDYYMFQGSEQRARNVYREVWDLLSADEERLDFRRRTLQTVNVLREMALPDFVGEGGGEAGRAGDDTLLQGRITLSYQVSARGRATGVKVVEAHPEEFSEMLMNVQREVRRRVFRPIFADGEPVTSENQLITHRFYYSESDLDAIRNSPQPVEEPEEPQEAEDAEST